MPQMSCHGHLWQNTTAARKLCALAERLRNTKVAAPRWRHARSSSPLKTITNHDRRAARSFTVAAPHPARARPIAIGACMGLGRRLRRAHAPSWPPAQASGALHQSAHGSGSFTSPLSRVQPSPSAAPCGGVPTHPTVALTARAPPRNTACCIALRPASTRSELRAVLRC